MHEDASEMYRAEIIGKFLGSGEGNIWEDTMW